MNGVAIIVRLDLETMRALEWHLENFRRRTGIDDCQLSDLAEVILREFGKGQTAREPQPPAAP